VDESNEKEITMNISPWYEEEEYEEYEFQTIVDPGEIKMNTMILPLSEDEIEALDRYMDNLSTGEIMELIDQEALVDCLSTLQDRDLNDLVSIELKSIYRNAVDTAKNIFVERYRSIKRGSYYDE